MQATATQTYDVVIMGAGFVGVCQARHLMLKVPGIKVALIDPRPAERTDRDLKLGESMIEVASMFICKELGLFEYMVENHPPKYGLNFHWPKDPAQTTSTDDYFHIWTNRQPPIDSFQINRAKFERDLLKMNQEMGAVFYNGRVTDVDLTPGDELHGVKVKVGNEHLELKAKHLIDGAGRRFIIGRKTDNVLFDPEDIYGVKTGSAWVRVKGVDRTLFHSGYDPNNATCSHYYATNHWFGHGHWLWMIPTDTQSMELSIGVVQHHDVIPADQVNSLDKFLSFLQANHNVLYQLITSGELIDFHYLPRLAHTSKQLYSPDNWYVIGDSACIFDAFYSMGTTLIAFSLESVTEIIRAKLAGEADAEQKRVAYNDFNLAWAARINHVMHKHTYQLGNASVMSWRIYFDYMLWFGISVPLYLGKWHLDLKFIPPYVESIHTGNAGFFNEVYTELQQMADRNLNLGLMDTYRADQLLWGYNTPKHFDDFLENAKYEPLRVNVFAGLKSTYFYVTIWYLKLLLTAYGPLSWLKPRRLYYCCYLLWTSLKMAIAEQFYLRQIKQVPVNSDVEKTRAEFRHYHHQPKLQPWAQTRPTMPVEAELQPMPGTEIESPQLVGVK